MNVFDAIPINSRGVVDNLKFNAGNRRWYWCSVGSLLGAALTHAPAQSFSISRSESTRALGFQVLLLEKDLSFKYSESR